MPIFKLGRDAMSKAEATEVVNRIIKEHVPEGQRKYVPHRGRVLAMLVRMIPQRVEHEVNRMRGYAFDIGEHGSSYVRVGEA